VRGGREGEVVRGRARDCSFYGAGEGNVLGWMVREPCRRVATFTRGRWQFRVESSGGLLPV